MSEQLATIDVAKFGRLCREIHRVVREGADGLSREQCFQSALNVCKALGVSVSVDSVEAWEKFRASGEPPDPNVKFSREWA